MDELCPKRSPENVVSFWLSYAKNVFLIFFFFKWLIISISLAKFRVPGHSSTLQFKSCHDNYSNNNRVLPLLCVNPQ